MISKKRLIKLTRDLIKIDSRNPPGNEFQIACFVRDYLRKRGLMVKIYEFKKNRSNVVAVLSGRDNEHSLLITPHLDTVPSGEFWTFNPFSGKIFKNRIYGLGASDCKGNLACGLEVINNLVEDKIVLGYNLMFAATADEESGSSLGLIPLLQKGIIRPDLAVVLDASDFNIVITQKGLIHIKVKIKGKRAHGAYPWLGKNAIDKALDILKDLKDRFVDLSNLCIQASNHPAFKQQLAKLLKPPTMNIGTIRGGDKVNVVADFCEFELDFRFLPGMSAEVLLKGIKKIIQNHTQDFNIEIEGMQKPYYIDKAHPLINCLRSAIKKTGVKPDIKGSEGATVISFFQDKGIPAIATGFGCEGKAHTADEYIIIDNLYKGAFALKEFLQNFEFNRI